MWLSVSVMEQLCPGTMRLSDKLRLPQDLLAEAINLDIAVCL